MAMRGPLPLHEWRFHDGEEGGKTWRVFLIAGDCLMIYDTCSGSYPLLRHLCMPPFACLLANSLQIEQFGDFVACYWARLRA